MNRGQQLALFYVGIVRKARLFTISVFSRLLFKQSDNYKKILINRDGAFGDSIVAIPAISIIRQNFPKAQIDLLSVNNGGISFKDLGLQKGLIDNLFVVRKKERAEKLRLLKQARYDLFIQIPQNIGVYKSIRNMLLVRFLLNIKSAFGWDSGRIKSFMRYQKQQLNIPTETQRFINALKKHGLSGETNYPFLLQTPNNAILESLTSKPKPIAFLIGGKLQPKKWPLENWVSLSNMLGEQHNILVLGGKDDVEEANYITSKTQNTVNFCGKLTIPELFFVLTKISLAVSLDTGAMHLCDAAQTKTIALFSTRDLSNKWWPNNNKSLVIEKVLPCSFCLKAACPDNICMKNITPTEVYNALKKMGV